MDTCSVCGRPADEDTALFRLARLDGKPGMIVTDPGCADSPRITAASPEDIAVLRARMVLARK